jgi:hypothetical protein
MGRYSTQTEFRDASGPDAENWSRESVLAHCLPKQAEKPFGAR